MKKNVNKLFKIIITLFIIFSTIGIFSNICYAATDAATDPVEDFIGTWSPTLVEKEKNVVLSRVNVIITVVKYIGMLASVISLMLMGIKFMVGSVEQRAQYKQTMFPWLIGAIMVFAITTIPDIIYNLAGQILK